MTLHAMVSPYGGGYASGSGSWSVGTSYVTTTSSMTSVPWVTIFPNTTGTIVTDLTDHYRRLEERLARVEKMLGIEEEE